MSNSPPPIPNHPHPHPQCLIYALRQWTRSALVPAMAFRLFGAKPLCWFIVSWTPANTFQWNLNRNCIIFIQENAFEIIISENGGNFVQARWVKLRMEIIWIKRPTCLKNLLCLPTCHVLILKLTAHAWLDGLSNFRLWVPGRLISLPTQPQYRSQIYCSSTAWDVLFPMSCIFYDLQFLMSSLYNCYR